MRVCSLCHRCYDDSVVSCTEAGHPPLSETRHGSPVMIAGYRLDYLLESGTNSETYRASRTDCGQSCQIRILSTDAESSRQFLDEAKLAAALFHPNVVDALSIDKPRPPAHAGGSDFRSKPTKIEWHQPEDDIPSVADASEVLSREQWTEIPAVQEEPEEITLVTAPSRRIRIEWDRPTGRQDLSPARRFSARTSDEIGFFPTILGDVEERKTIDLDPGDSFLSTYYDSSRAGSSVPYRSLAIGGGFIALMVLFIFGDDFVGRYLSKGRSADSVAVKTTSAKEALPRAGQPGAVSPPRKKAPKYFQKPQMEDDDSDANRSKPVPPKPKASLSALVISSGKGKIRSKIEPPKKSADINPHSVPDKTANLTRPRVVKTPALEE